MTYRAPSIQHSTYTSLCLGPSDGENPLNGSRHLNDSCAWRSRPELWRAAAPPLMRSVRIKVSLSSTQKVIRSQSEVVVLGFLLFQVPPCLVWLFFLSYPSFHWSLVTVSWFSERYTFSLRKNAFSEKNYLMRASFFTRLLQRFASFSKARETFSEILSWICFTIASSWSPEAASHLEQPQVDLTCPLLRCPCESSVNCHFFHGCHRLFPDFPSLSCW